MIARQPWAACASGAQSRNGLLFTRLIEQASFLRPFSVPAIQSAREPDPWGLYALSRVNDLWIRAFQREPGIARSSQSSNPPRMISLLCWNRRFGPCLMLGNRMFSRAGARVSGGRRFISKQVAESSTQEERTELPLNRCFIVANRQWMEIMCSLPLQRVSSPQLSPHRRRTDPRRLGIKA